MGDDDAIDWSAVGAAIETCRAQLGISWAQVAREAGLDVTTVYHYRRGRGRLAATLRQIDRGLRLPVGTLESVGKGHPLPAGDQSDSARLDQLEAEQQQLRDELSAALSDLELKLADEIADLAERVERAVRDLRDRR